MIRIWPCRTRDYTNPPEDNLIVESLKKLLESGRLEMAPAH